MECQIIPNISTEKTYSTLRNNPKYLKTLLNKTVEISTINGKVHKGIVYVVDPISGSIVTLTKSKEKYDVNIFMGHAIQSLEVFSNELNINDLLPQTNYEPICNADLKVKKTCLKLWLEKNLIDVTEDEVYLKIGSDLIIEPPYDKTHCFSSNTIILQRIQDIMSKMPNTV